MRIFQAFIKVLSFASLIKLLTLFLQSPNSIIREESLSLIICVFTLREEDAYLNYAKLTDLVQKLVYTNESDLKDKVRLIYPLESRISLWSFGDCFSQNEAAWLIPAVCRAGGRTYVLSRIVATSWFTAFYWFEPYIGIPSQQ